MQERSSSAGLGLGVLSAATFGTSGTFAASLLAAGWTAGSAVTWRVVVAALVIAPFALPQLRGRRGALRRGRRTMTAYGLVAVAGTQLAYFTSVQYLPVAVALLLEYSGALLVVLWLWVRGGQRPRRLTVAGAGLAVGGLVLVLDLSGGASLDPVGLLWAAGAAVGLAVYFLLSAGTDDALPPLVVAWSGLTVGAVALLAAGLAGVLPLAAPRTDVVLLDAEVSWLVPVLGLSVVAAVVAYVAGIAGARRLGPKVASFVGLSEVLFAVGFAWLLLGQSLSAVQLLGGLLVVVGIALVRVDELRGPSARPIGPPHEQVVAAA